MSSSLKIHIVGAGLIGTSIALAAKIAGHEVTINDLEISNQNLAADLLGSSPDDDQNPDFIFVAVPPSVVSEVVLAQLRLYSKSIVVDVTSVKTKVLNEIECFPELLPRFVPTHPIAGREVSGPSSAQGDLFQGRAWIVTPRNGEGDFEVVRVESLLRQFGAIVHRMSPEHHDYLFAKISHAPQILSTLLAGSLNELGSDVQLSGQGLRDVTRIAGSDGHLWAEIIEANSSEVLAALEKFRAELVEMEDAISKNDRERIIKFFEKGRDGKNLFSGKHGGVPRDYAIFHIVIEDKPGVLGELFNLCASRKINVEDLGIEHSPNQETGLISISVAKSQESTLKDALTQGKWKFHIQGETK